MAVGQRWLAATGAFVALLWMAGIGALWNVSTGLTHWEMRASWILGVTIGAAAFAATAASVLQFRATRDRPSRIWTVDLPRPGMIERPTVVSAVLARLTARDATVVGIGTGLYGPGGFGKTTLARQVCTKPAVRRHYRHALWVTLGEQGSVTDLVNNVNGLCRKLSEQHRQVDDLEQAGQELGRLLDLYPLVLLVIDDVWSAADLKPFLHGGRRCVRLVTTRRPDVLPAAVRQRSVQVDQLTDSQTRQLLTTDTGRVARRSRDALVRLTGRWPLLVNLAHGWLLDGGTPAGLITQLEEGPDTLDVTDEASRNAAVDVSIQASMQRLTATQQDLFATLAVFAEDVAIPCQVLTIWWAVRNGLPIGQVGEVLDRLDGLSLLADYRRDDGTIRLHGVIRAYLRRRVGQGLAGLHRSLIDAARALLPNTPRDGTAAVVATTRVQRLPVAQPVHAPSRGRAF